MTLQEWAAKYDCPISGPTTETGACSVVFQETTGEKRRELFTLSDYKVSTVSGIVFWLLPVPSVVLDSEAGYKVIHRPRTYTGW